LADAGRSGDLADPAGFKIYLWEVRTTGKQPTAIRGNLV
jgi:hypothetical protein